MNVPETLTQLSLGLTCKPKDVIYTVIDINVCGEVIKVECAQIHYEDITDEILMHLLKQRIAGIQKYKDINKIDLYERDTCHRWSLGRISSLDIPDVFKERFTDGEMLDDPSVIEDILIDFITEYNNRKHIKKDAETIGCEEQHDGECKRCHRCAYVRSVDEFPEDDNYCYSCHQEMDNA